MGLAANENKYGCFVFTRNYTFVSWRRVGLNKQLLKHPLGSDLLLHNQLITNTSLRRLFCSVFLNN